VYAPAEGSFIIHTPNNEASKYWIGGSGQHGKVRHPGLCVRQHWTLV
jgi:hypothetical protein